ncbi:hypothetical protein WJX84_011410 [Apatococcus fuscideae]|uniref:DDE Tnp4 domain-containing protein n=1 Tax=Apatococcus fuscideae TaxID=2026836 RepID=A0AAW1T8X9_9CHLO
MVHSQFFDGGQNLLADPGYVGSEFAPGAKPKGQAQKFPLAGAHGRTTFSKAREIHSLLFHTACMLKNRIWRLRGNYPRGERHFHGQGHYCEHQEEYRAMYRNLNDYNP